LGVQKENLIFLKGNAIDSLQGKNYYIGYEKIGLRFIHAAEYVGGRGELPQNRYLYMALDIKRGQR
jgi:hypothetical protein